MRYDTALNLVLPSWWHTVSAEDKHKACNGVGPDFFPGWIRDLLDRVFFWAADGVLVHDVEYAYGESKIMADLRLLANCILCGGLAPRRVVLSAVAFAAVLFFGRRAWKEGHNHEVDKKGDPIIY
ncbi:MAG TPA: hypothetical protein PLE35_04550 [Lentisphaeria bacterium]|nr:hypothetical protein [Lentisphaeria bacterium]